MADPAIPHAGPAKEPDAASLLGQQNLSAGHDEASANNNNNFNHFDDLDIQDVELAHIIEEQFRAEVAARDRDNGNQPPLGYQVDEKPMAATDLKSKCLGQVQAVFPDICIQHVSVLCDTVSNQADVLVAHILEDMDKGNPYPKFIDTKTRQKRKRELDEDEEAAREYSAADRPANTDIVNQRNM